MQNVVSGINFHTLAQNGKRGVIAVRKIKDHSDRSVQCWIEWVPLLTVLDSGNRFLAPPHAIKLFKPSRLLAMPGLT